MFIQSNAPYKSIRIIQPPIELPDFLILSGINGSGKTHLLEAAGANIIAIVESGRQITSIKLANHNTLAPNPSDVFSYENIRQISAHPLTLYQNYKISKSQNPDHTLEHLYGTSNVTELIEKIAQRAGKDIDALEDNDFILHYPEAEIEISQGNFFHQNFSSLFKRYQSKWYLNKFNQFLNSTEGNVPFLSDEEFKKTYGEPPWLLVNEILKAANLGYQITTPEGQTLESPFQPLLINDSNNVAINFGDLSSGEKVIMSLALSLYNSQFDIEFPEVLLMDEPDAHLHPSMTKQFLEVIQSVFVKEKGIKVIITTHSPSTVALGPEESLFIMNKTDPRITKATKDQALRILTAGVPTLSINYENRRQVFVESKYDVMFYEKVYEKLKGKLVNEISINFISSGVGGQGNCDQVKEIVNKLTGYGNRTIYGIIDWDTKNSGNDYVKVLGKDKRYSVENYIFDPIWLAAFLVREKYIDLTKLGLDSGDRYTDFNNFSDTKLQNAANYIVNQVRTKAGNPTDTHVQDVEYTGGRKIRLPTWFLTIQGHLLESNIKELFPQLNRYRNEGELKREIINKVIDDIPEFIPKDVFFILSEIQDYSI